MHGLKAKPHSFTSKESWNQSNELLFYYTSSSTTFY